MKKTLIALLALAGTAIAGDVALFDFGGTNVPGSTDKSYTLTDSITGYAITLSSSSVLGTSVTYDDGNENTTNQAYTSWADLPSGSNNSYDITAITNQLDTHIGANISATAPTFITGGGNNLNITFSGLEAGQSYNIGLITGVPFEGSGKWNSITVGNTVTGDVYKYASSASTEITLNSGNTGENIEVKNVTGYSFDSVVANEDGIITLTINKNSHKASLNGAAITKVIPEPTTATLSLLALAGLAARRRRK